ncbi:hypothetical protein BVC80_1799g41 [Macleaya cordata]|uniref:Uncharacterized protein n=1 Tax=Macleaya cordata TaxID=56857 RepID=A0A200QPI3_MACCD|nr:hypothetical protein BVC80_1799g41 [Macleaya cordata]
MDVLEYSQVEALILTYVSFGFFTTVNSFWTLVAVLTAAISFWRIRAVGSISLPHKSDGSPSFYDIKTQDQSEDLVVEEEEEEEEGVLQVCSSCSSSSVGYSAVIEDGTVKGNRDQVYGYYGEFSWEQILQVRMRSTGDLGWYGCQDLTSLNGSVVKLWRERC